jgi:hypothetical protein
MLWKLDDLLVLLPLEFKSLKIHKKRGVTPEQVFLCKHEF